MTRYIEDTVVVGEMAYTTTDTDNAFKFSAANYKIRLLQACYEKRKNIISHLIVTERAATYDEIPIQPTSPLKRYARIIEVEFTQKACENSSCNSSKENGVCLPGEAASYYYIGDNGHGIQCQPSCFNTISRPSNAGKVNVKATYNEKGERVAEAPLLVWVPEAKKCRLANSPMISWLEKTYFRSDSHYELRLNDMPTGFSRVRDYESNPMGIGWRYTMNPAYCGYFDREWDGKSCEMTAFEKYGVDSIIGSQIFNVIRAGIRKLTTGNSLKLPENLPKLPTNVEKTFTLEGWENDVVENFKLPPVLDVSEVYNEQQQQQQQQRRCIRQQRDVGDSIATLFESLIEMLGNKDFWANVTIGTAGDIFISGVKKGARRLANKLTRFLVNGSIRTILKRLGSKVIGSALKTVFLRATLSMVLRVASKVALALAKFAGAAATVVGWVLVVFQILDLLFTFWDPFGYNNLYPPELPSDMMFAGEIALREQLGTAVIDYEFETLAHSLLTEDELLELQVDSLLDTIVYLNSLEVNSEGTRIDKGDEIEFSADQDQSLAIDRARNASLAKHTIRLTSDTLASDNARFTFRATLTNRVNRLCFGLIVLALPIFAISSTFAIFAIIILLICMCTVIILLDNGQIYQKLYDFIIKKQLG